MDGTAETAVGSGVSLSEAGARRIHALLAEPGNARMTLRVAVSGGGCSGFQYGFSLDEARNEDDHVIERDGALVLIDVVSWGFLVGAEIHYEDQLVGAYFTVRNPNAISTCGCGTSFAVG